MVDSPSSMASIGDIFLQGQRNVFKSNSPAADVALGVAASLGLSFSIARWLLGSGSTKMNIRNDDYKDQEEIIVVKGGLLFSLMRFVRHSLRKMLLDADELQRYESAENLNDVHVVDGASITHQASCHCQSVRLEIRAPRTLVGKEGPGKISYRHTEVKSSGLRFVRGQGNLKTYYVVLEDSEERGAHVFCDRCGCHLLFAPSKKSNRLLVNINCIDEGIRKIRIVDTKSTLSEGTALEGQWDDPQLTTISEVPLNSHPYFQPQNPPAFKNYDSLSTDGSVGRWNLYDQVQNLSDAYDIVENVPRTPTTVDSFTATATDVQSLPPLRIPRGNSDSASVITESDTFSVAHSEFGMSLTSPAKISHPNAKPLPQLYDQMKYHMKKHVSPSTKSSSAQDLE